MKTSSPEETYRRPSTPSDKIFPSIFSRIQLFLPHLAGQKALQGYLSTIDQGFISLANFAAAILLARAVNPTEFGTYSVGFLLIHCVRAIQDGLIVQPLNAFGASLSLKRFRRYFSANAVLQSVLALASAVSAAVLGWLLIVTGNDTAGPTLLALWFAFLTWQMQEFLRRAFYTRGEVAKAAVNTTLTNAVRLGVMIWWMGAGRLDTGIDGLHAIAWGSLAGLFLGLWQARPYWTRRGVTVVGAWKRNWGYGRWVLGGSLTNWAAVEVYPIIAAGMVSFAAAGAYRALQTLVAPVHLLLRALDTFSTPWAAKEYHQNGRAGLSRLVKIMYLVAGVPIIGWLLLINFFSTPLLRLLYQETYLPYSNGAIWMALFYSLLYAYWPMQVAHKALRATRPLFLANGAAIVSMFTIGILAVRQWGLYGAIGGQALNALIVTVVLWLSWRAGRR